MLAHPRLRPGLTIASAGTHAVAGYAMDPVTASVLAEYGADPNDHRSRQLTRDMVADADLTLTATAEQRGAVLNLDPHSMRRTFTMREFVRLSGPLPPPRPVPAGDKWRRQVREVAERRGLGEPAAPGADNIADPFGATEDEVRRCVGLINSAVESILRTLALSD